MKQVLKYEKTNKAAGVLQYSKVYKLNKDVGVLYLT